MTIPNRPGYQSEWTRFAFAAGMADALLVVLETRGITITYKAGCVIINCTDLQRLSQWLKEAVVVKRVEELTGLVPPAPG